MTNLSSISQSLEVKPQLENVVVELTPESPLVPILPLPADNFESNVFVRRPGVNPEDAKVLFSSGRPARDQLVFRSRVLVDQVGVENVEFVAL